MLVHRGARERCLGPHTVQYFDAFFFKNDAYSAGSSLPPRVVTRPPIVRAFARARARCLSLSLSLSLRRAFRARAAEVSLTRNNYTANTAAANGGALYVEFAQALAVADSRFERNAADDARQSRELEGDGPFRWLGRELRRGRGSREELRFRLTCRAWC